MAIHALISLLSISLLLLILYGPWQWLWIDAARQQIFEERDKIFDIAAKGLLSFDSIEYRTIRSSIEKSIRFAHSLSLPRLLFLYLSHRRLSFIPESSDLKIAISNIADESVKNKVQSIVERSNNILIASIILRSPLVLLAIIVILVFFAPAMLILYVLGYELIPTGIVIRRKVRRMGDIAQIEAENTPLSAAAYWRPFGLSKAA